MRSNLKRTQKKPARPSVPKISQASTPGIARTFPNADRIGNQQQAAQNENSRVFIHSMSITTLRDELVITKVLTKCKQPARLPDQKWA